MMCAKDAETSGRTAPRRGVRPRDGRKRSRLDAIHYDRERTDYAGRALMFAGAALSRDVRPSAPAVPATKSRSGSRAEWRSPRSLAGCIA